MSSADRLHRLANQTFEEFQAEIRAGERVCAESDLYWRTNRWAEDGRDMTIKLGPIVMIDARENVGRCTVAESFLKMREADTARLVRR